MPGNQVFLSFNSHIRLLSNQIHTIFLQFVKLHDRILVSWNSSLIFYMGISLLTKPTAFDPVYDSQPFKGELVRNALWTVRLRWLGGAVIIAGSLLAQFADVIDQAAVLIGIGVAVLGYNILISRAMGSGRARLTYQRAQRIWLVQILADVSSLTAIIYFCGGIESPVIIFWGYALVSSNHSVSRHCKRTYMILPDWAAT